MMEVFRISKEKYIRDLSGLGAKTYGGRWNRPGVSVLYTSSHRSLALLELLVHFESSDAIENTFRFAKINVPESKTMEVDFDFTKADMSSYNNADLWDLTEYYFFDMNVLGIWVPSIIVPQEKNLLLNPIHADFKHVKLREIEHVSLDNRLI